jgi:hypothetical protein
VGVFFFKQLFICMDILKDISNSEEKDIIVSLPKDKTWLEYLSYLMELKVSEKTFGVIVSTVPKTAPGKKCFIVFDGFLRGWMEISKLRETEDNDICIELLPSMTSTVHKIPMADIEEYKYYFDNSNMQ